MTPTPRTPDRVGRRAHPAWWVAGATFLAIVAAALPIVVRRARMPAASEKSVST